MRKIIDLDEYRPHACIRTSDGNAHVIPMSVFENIINGKLRLVDIDDWELISKAIIHDWYLCLMRPDTGGEE